MATDQKFKNIAFLFVVTTGRVPVIFRKSLPELHIAFQLENVTHVSSTPSMVYRRGLERPREPSTDDEVRVH